MRLNNGPAALNWLGIVRLGLVQAALGCVVVLITSTMNRVMVVEYAIPALLPGALVALHYAVQLIRPHFGHGSDVGGRRTPWILGGMGVLATAGVLCALATALLASRFWAGLALAALAYALVGLGVGAAGTSLLALLASRVAAGRRAAAATVMWIMMIAGFAVTSTVVGRFLDPFSAGRLIKVTGVAALTAFVLACLALWRVEGRAPLRGAAAAAPAAPRMPFKAALERVWADPQARRFTWFVFISMLAYSAQELLLEPFAGLVFGYTVGASARLSGSWHSGVALGMVSVGLICTNLKKLGSLRAWTVAGCMGSAVALLGLALTAWAGRPELLQLCVMALGVANGIFAVSAIGSMMELSHQGESGSAGIRMGLWGAAQAVAFACGGVFGNIAVDVVRRALGASAPAFAFVFLCEATLFCVAARFALRGNRTRTLAPSGIVAAS
jgi:MFS transporter, BCD family, chlorophyll transporter